MEALIVIALILAGFIGAWFFLARRRNGKARPNRKVSTLSEYRRREKPRSPPGGTPGLVLAMLMLAPWLTGCGGGRDDARLSQTEISPSWSNPNWPSGLSVAETRCVRLKVTHSENPDAGAAVIRGEEVEREWLSTITLCDGAWGSIADKRWGTLFLEIEQPASPAEETQ